VSVSQLSGKPECSGRQSGPCTKHSIEMIQTGESRPDHDIGDRFRSRLQKLLRVIDSHSENLIKYRSLKLVAKSAFQRSAWNLAVGNYIVHRQIASGKVLLNVPERARNVRVLDPRTSVLFRVTTPFGAIRLGISGGDPPFIR
jgi:hypothetical protein